jgi:uncharacterized Rmd1/YagE family protein
MFSAVGKTTKSRSAVAAAGCHPSRNVYDLEVTVSGVESGVPKLPSDQFEAHAVFVAERLDLRSFTPRLASNAHIVEMEGGGWAILFRYGVVVFFDVSADARARYVERLGRGVGEAYAEPEREAQHLRVDASPEGVGADGAIIIHDTSVERLQVVADALAKSVVLAHYEEELAQSFNSVEPLAAELVRGRERRRVGDLLRQIGGTLLIQHKMVGRVAVGEKLELLWQRPDLERLHLRMEDEYELIERQTSLERKLALINTTATTALEMVRARRSLRVEWYIVLLIVVEIVLTLYQMLAH